MLLIKQKRERGYGSLSDEIEEAEVRINVSKGETLL